MVGTFVSTIILSLQWGTQIGFLYLGNRGSVIHNAEGGDVVIVGILVGIDTDAKLVVVP